MKFRLLSQLLCLICVASVFLIGGCIHNNIPYPRIQANFLTLDVAGQNGTTAIDTVSTTATVTFPESADIYSARVTGYTITPGAEITDNPFGSPLDLSSPVYVYLKMYDTSTLWKITGVQNIARYFEVSGQMGATVIDVPGHRIVVYVNDRTDLAAVPVVRAKLAAEGSVMTPDLSEGGTYDGRKAFTITTERFGHTDTWTVYTEVVAEAVTTVSVDAWTCVAWVNGQAEAGLDNGVEYRIAGSEQWTRVPAADVTHDGGTFKARIAHLSPQTDYETRAYSADNYGAILTFTTGQELQLPNSSFDDWWLDGRIWCPWNQDGIPYWGSGNKGAATVGSSNTVPTDDTPTGTGRAAKLETKWVVVKLAAGNIFTGDYVRTDGTNGVLSFGREFTQRPVRLQGQYKFTPAIIDHTSTDFKYLMGQPDTCIVWMALIDSPQPFEIRTNPRDRQLFNPDAPEVIAYGKMEQSDGVASWVPFDFELSYRSTSRVPRYIIVCASASKYGDYFSGGSGATLYLDDLKLVYDYR